MFQGLVDSFYSILGYDDANKSEMNQLLVEGFNSILITNLTVESIGYSRFFNPKDYIVISFDKNMAIDECMEYLSSMKEKVIERLFGDECAADERFYTELFPFNFTEGKWTEDNKFLVPMEEGVVYNLKFLLPTDLVLIVMNVITSLSGMRQLKYDPEENMCDESFQGESYLYCARFYNRIFQDTFVELLSVLITGFENGPRKTEDFLKEEGNRIYIKKSIFDDPRLIKDIVKYEVSLTCRSFQNSSSESRAVKILKFAVVDLIRKALQYLPIDSMWHTNYCDLEQCYILAPVVDCGSYIEFLEEKEVNHINNEIFGGTEVLCDLKDSIQQRGLPGLGSQKIYAIDFSNQDIACCVMEKIVKISVINKDHELSIDPACVQAMQSETQKTLEPYSGRTRIYKKDIDPMRIDNFTDMIEREKEGMNPNQSSSSKSGQVSSEVEKDGESSSTSKSQSSGSNTVPGSPLEQIPDSGRTGIYKKDINPKRIDNFTDMIEHEKEGMNPNQSSSSKSGQVSSEVEKDGESGSPSKSQSSGSNTVPGSPLEQIPDSERTRIYKKDIDPKRIDNFTDRIEREKERMKQNRVVITDYE